jgi:hypothetical protein
MALLAGEGMYRESSGSPHSRKLAIQTLPGPFLCCWRSADAPRRARPRAKLDEVTSAGRVPRTKAEKGPSNPSA